MRLSAIRTTALAAIALLTACHGQKDAPTNQRSAGVALTPFATVRLQDGDTAYLGKANALAVSSNGEFFVTDMVSRRVLRFDASGAFIDAIGRGGREPNEFEGPSWLTSLDDSTLAIVDVLSRRAALWDLPRRRVRASADSRELLNVHRDRFLAIWGTVSVNVAGLASRYVRGKSTTVIGQVLKTVVSTSGASRYAHVRVPTFAHAHVELVRKLSGVASRNRARKATTAHGGQRKRLT